MGTPAPQNTLHPAVKALKASGAGRVKVAASDTDGMLLHKNRFFSVSEPYSNGGLCDVATGRDMLDACDDNTAVTGWQHGFPEALPRLDLATFRFVPWDDNVPFFRGEFFKALMDEMLAFGIPVEGLHTETGPAWKRVLSSPRRPSAAAILAPSTSPARRARGSRPTACFNSRTLPATGHGASGWTR